MLLRSGIRLQECFETLQVDLGGTQLGFDSGNLGRSAVHLGLGLTDLLGSSAGQQQPDLGVGGIALGPGPTDLQLHVARIEIGDNRPGRHPIPFRHPQFDETAADLRGDLHFRRFHVT